MNIDEQIAILEAFKAKNRIDWTSTITGMSGAIWITTDPDWKFNFQHVIYEICPRTILVNGIEVPEPVRALNSGVRQEFFVVSFGHENGVSRQRFDDTSWENKCLNEGVVHLTESAARQHYEALIAPSRVKS